MKLKLCAFAIISSCLLSACTTDILLGGSNPAQRERIQQDSIVAFGHTKAESKIMPASELLMLGQRYVYLIDNSQFEIQGRQSISNDKLMAILNVKLSRAFEISKAPYTTVKEGKGFFSCYIGAKIARIF